MCGIVGIVGTSPVNQRLYDALTVLQHRERIVQTLIDGTGPDDPNYSAHAKTSCFANAPRDLPRKPHDV